MFSVNGKRSLLQMGPVPGVEEDNTYSNIWLARKWFPYGSLPAF
jgi:hypothetical protein